MTTKTAPVPPKRVLVTAERGAPRNRSVIETPGGAPDLQVITVPEWRQVLIRVVRTYLQTFLGVLLAESSGATDAVGVHIAAPDFLDKCLVSASIALAPAVISLIQNAVEILSKLDNPQTRA